MKYYQLILIGLALTFSIVFSAHSQTQDLFSPTIKLAIDNSAETSAQVRDELVFEALVDDDIQVSQVTLYFRYASQTAYRKNEMRLVRNDSNRYRTTIMLDDQEVSRIEYFIDAEDTSGNFSLKGQKFNPLVRVLKTVAPLATSEFLNNEKKKTDSNSRSNSDTNETALARNRSKLYVNVEPIDARVRIMNIEPKYYPGIELTRGNSYRIIVDKAGFHDFDNVVLIDKATEQLNVTLELKPDITSSLKMTVANEAVSCNDVVQNNIAWDYSGDKVWTEANIEVLCGDVNSAEPAKCFSTVMHDDIDWGGGTKWQWQNALNLCSRTQDAQVTVQCFKNSIQEGFQWDQAIAFCKIK